MADNFVANAGSGGSTFAADDIGGGVLATRLKRVHGRDGTGVDVGTGFTLVSAATTNATSVKASAGVLHSIIATNTNASARYLKLYNKASAPTVGTDTPVATFCLHGTGGIAISLDPGWDFSTGIAYALTTGALASDTGAVAASEITVNGVYT